MNGTSSILTDEGESLEVFFKQKMMMIIIIIIGYYGFVVISFSLVKFSYKMKKQSILELVNFCFVWFKLCFKIVNEWLTNDNDDDFLVPKWTFFSRFNILKSPNSNHQ